MWWSDSENSVQRSAVLEDVQKNFNDYMDARESDGYQIYPGTESEQYDFTAERQSVRGTNIVAATAHLVKSCLRPGILCIHVGFMYAGLWTSVAVTASFGGILYYTMTLLIRSAQKLYVRLRVPKLSYSELTEMAVATGPCKWLRNFSKPIRYWVDFCVVAEMCGSCCIYEIIIAKTVKLFSESVSCSIKDADIHIRYYILIISGPLVILSVIRNLKYLAPFSFLAEAIVVICIMSTMYYSLTNAENISARAAFKDFKGLHMLFGVCLYSLGGFTIILPIENNMKKPRYYFIVLQYGVTIAVAIVIITGFIGYWGWGENSSSPVTLHMPVQTVHQVFQCLIALMLSIIFAVHFWVPFRIIWFYIGRLHRKNRAVWEIFYRLLSIILITALAAAFPDIMRLIIFIGNFFTASVTFIFPPFIETLVSWKEHPRGKKFRWCFCRNLLFIGIGIYFCGQAIYFTIMNPT